MEALQARHRKESRELQARITQKKKNATKKTRKGVNDECDNLQRDLQERQQAEIAALRQTAPVDGVHGLHINGDREERDESGQCDSPKEVDSVVESAHAERRPVHEEMASEGGPTPDLDGRPRKANRQKARLARRAAEQEAQAIQAAEESALLPDLREQEREAMNKHLRNLSLREISIRPDGHCLYSAIATQLSEQQLRGRASDTSVPVKAYQVVRNSVGDFISSHPDDFSAFLEEPLAGYVSKIKNTAEWGGQLELQAAARLYEMDISVLQADGRVERIEAGSGLGRDPLWLAYYRHSFGLGEHYNALQKIS